MKRKRRIIVHSEDYVLSEFSLILTHSTAEEGSGYGSIQKKMIHLRNNKLSVLNILG